MNDNFPGIHEINTLNLLVHGGNSLVMLCELAVTAHPLRFAHALYGASAGLAYGVFSAFYWAVGGTDRIGMPAIYPSLDWNKPGTLLFLALKTYSESTKILNYNNIAKPFDIGYYFDSL